MIVVGHFNELWNRFNAAGGTPVLTAFIGVIATGIVTYALQERKNRIEDQRQQRDAKRLRGEELYHLFDKWLIDIRQATSNLAWKIQTGGHMESEIESAYGDQPTYRRVVMLGNVDFPGMVGILHVLGQTYTAHGGILSTIGVEPNEATVVPPLKKFIDDLNEIGDQFQSTLLGEMKALYK
jgi:hypothetical protein